MRLRPVLLTGDNERAARFVAGTVGIDQVIAGVLPEGKAAPVKEQGAAGRPVPADRGAAMAFSSVFVVANRLRPRRFQPARQASPGI